MRKKIELESYLVDCVTKQEFVDLAMQAIEQKDDVWVWTPNLDMFRYCRTNTVVGEFIHKSSPDIVLADGMPLVWASYLQGTPLPERVPGSTTIWLVCEAAAKQGHSVFFLGGGEPDTAIRAADVLVKTYPGLKVAGTHYPPFGFEKDQKEVDQIVDALNATKPDIIFVALSFPKGEYLIERIRAQCGPALWMGVGISFSFITQDVKRAPVWMQKIGLEWTHRMAQEPRRLYKRYLFHDIPFVFGILGRSFSKRFKS